MTMNITFDLLDLLRDEKLKDKFLELGREYFGEEFEKDPCEIVWEQKKSAKRIVDEAFANGTLDGDKPTRLDAICIYTDNSEVQVCASYYCPHVLCPITIAKDGRAHIGPSIGVALQGATEEIEQQWNRELNWNWIDGHQSIHFIFRDEWEREHAKQVERAKEKESV